MGAFAHGYGLVIGVGEYSDPEWNVPIAERDAQAIHAALTDPAAGGYPPAQVELMTGAAASSAGVLKALERLAARADRGDTVLIAITSHGALNERDLYTLATSDAQFIDGTRVRVGTGLNIRDLANALMQIRAERLLLVINACFAGYASALASRGGLREEPSGTALPNSGADALLASGKGRALITASRADQRSYFQPDAPHSVFGQALIDGLRGVGISPRSGYIGLFELYGRIYTQVSNPSTSRGNRQEPVLSLVDGVGPFPVALHSGADSVDVGQIQQARPEGAIRSVQITVDNRIGFLISGTNQQIGEIHAGDISGGSIIRDSTIGTIYIGEQAQPSAPPQPANGVGDAQVGGLQIGDTAAENLIKGNQTSLSSGGSTDIAGNRAASEVLRRICDQIAVARNVDEDARDDAANKLKQAARALDQGDQTRAIQRIGEALETLDAMGNGYINSLTRKLRAVREAL